MNTPMQPQVWDSPVLVWTVGKVASSSVFATLKHYGFDALHVHYLSDWLLSSQVHQTYAGQVLPLNIVTSLRFRHGFDRNLYRTPIRVVTLVRDPLARNVSAYFENLGRFAKNQKLDAGAHVQNFLDKYPHDIVLDWFDHELRDVAGIDFRKLNFDPDKGWRIRREERFHLLVLRAEEPDAAKLEALSSFFEMPMTELIRKNEGSAKAYRELYQAFKDQLTLPKAHVDHMYDNEFCATFWTPTEIHRMKDAWRVCERSPAPAIVPVGAPALAPYRGVVAATPPAQDSDAIAALENAYAQPGALAPALRQALGPMRKSGDLVGHVRAYWRCDFEGLERSAALRVSFDLTRTIESPTLSVRLYSSDGVLISEFSPLAQCKPLQAGRHAFTLNMAQLPLNPGHYLPIFSLAEGHDKAIVHRMPLQLLVIEDEALTPGLLRAHFDWVESPMLPLKT